MWTEWSARERALLAKLETAARAVRAADRIAAIAGRVEEILARDRTAIEAWEPVPLETYGQLPLSIRSSWVFILRAGATTGAERHPNSRQRMMSWQGRGDFQVRPGRSWKSHFLVSDPDAPLESRWISIPPNVWHQGVVPAQDWIVLSFHTAAGGDLIEERPGDSASAPKRRRRYADVKQA